MTANARQSRILVVDDDTVLRETFARILQFIGKHEVVMAESGPAALALFEGGDRFDLMLTDYHMPGMTGVGLVSALYKRGIEVPTLLISADVCQDDLAREKNVGVANIVGFLRKPVELDHLVRVVRAALCGAVHGSLIL